MVALLVAIFQAIAALPQIAQYAERFGAAIVAWWMSRQTSSNLAALSDAAAQAGRAKTDADRYKAAQAWLAAQSNARPA